MRVARQRNTNVSNIRNAALKRELEVLFVEDVMEILGIGHSKAYQIMREMNKELEAEGYYTLGGRVPVKRFYEKYYCGTTPATHGGERSGINARRNTQAVPKRA